MNMAMYLFGDTHGTLEMHKIFPENFIEGAALTRNDYVVVLGDWGVPFVTHGPNWYLKQSDKTMIKKLAALPFTVLFVDGNHDNHLFWRSRTKISKFGGLVQSLPGTDNVFHLCRGEYYNIDGHTFWVMGGALSRDSVYRTINRDWWLEEIPSIQEENHGILTLQQHNMSVEYILTHTPPERAIPLLKAADGSSLGMFYNSIDMCARFLNFVQENVNYKEWYCGHMHIDQAIPDMRLQVLYNTYRRIY